MGLPRLGGGQAILVTPTNPVLVRSNLDKHPVSIRTSVSGPETPQECDGEPEDSEDGDQKTRLDPSVANLEPVQHPRVGSDSCVSRLVHSAIFQNMTVLVIVLNGIWMGVDVEWNNETLRSDAGRLPLEPTSTYIENSFCGYFSMEVVLRFLSFRHKCRCLRDGWFLFDTLLVLLMVTDMWVLPIIESVADSGNLQSGLNRVSTLRLLRLLRLTRMARIMKYFPELMTLVRGLVNAMYSVVFILFFMMGLTYIFGIVFTNQLGEPGYVEPPGISYPSAKSLFSDLGSSMMTLTTIAILGDEVANVMASIKKESLALMWLFAIFLVMTGITLVNMLIGVVCQVIAESSQEEQEQRQVNELRACFWQAFQAMDASNDGLINEEEWAVIKDNEKVRNALQRLGVDLQHMEERLTQMQEMLFGRKSAAGGQSKALSFEEFVDKVIQLRWDTPANALDIEILKSTVMSEDRAWNRKLDNVEACLARMLMRRAGVDYEDDRHERLAWLRDVPADVLLCALQNRPLMTSPRGLRPDVGGPVSPGKKGRLLESPTSSRASSPSRTTRRPGQAHSIASSMPVTARSAPEVSTVDSPTSHGPSSANHSSRRASTESSWAVTDL